MSRIHSPILTDDDAAGTAVLLGLDPSNPRDLTRARLVNRRRSIDYLRKGTTTAAGDGIRRTIGQDRAHATTADSRQATGDPRAMDPATLAEAHDTIRAILPRLTRAETAALLVLAQSNGKASGKELGDALGCAPATAYVHIGRLRRKALAALGGA